MRRLKVDDDSGVAAIFVVLALPLLLAFAALVFDGGRGIVARRQAQSAADAGALAKAIDCAAKRPATSFVPYETNGATLSNSPACGAGSTTVSMTRTVQLLFAPGGGVRNVTRSATASWGTLGRATTLPLTIADCEFSSARLDGTTDITILLDDPQPSSGCSSLPGGFSQLAASGCAVSVSSSGTIAGDTGKDMQKVAACLPSLPTDVLIPIYDAKACASAGCKGSGPYPIVGFAVFRVTGYRFNNANSAAGTLKTQKCPVSELDQNNGNGHDNCIRGDFIRFATSQGAPGTSTNFGTYLAYLTS